MSAGGTPSYRGSLVDRTPWAASLDVSSAQASGELLVPLLLERTLVTGISADISTQILHLDGLKKARAMTQSPELWQDTKLPLLLFRVCVGHTDESEDEQHIMLWNWQRHAGFTAQDFQHHESQAGTDQAHERTDRNVFGHAAALHTYLT